MSKKNTQSDLPPKKIRQYDNQNWLHPWEHLDQLGHADRLIIEYGEGIYVYDTDGKKLLDGPAGMWCVQVGYGRQDMADAIAAQVKRLAYMTPFSLTSSPSANLAKKLAELSPGDLNHVFFTTGGSTAVDSAIRFVHLYNNLLGRPKKKHIIAQANAYHGATFLCSQISSRDEGETWFDTETPLAHLLPQFPKNGSCDEAVNAFEAQILALKPEHVAAFIAEPVQGAGGVIVPPTDYLKRCRDICQKYDVLYISDEVVTGFGRLGHWFASESVFNVNPDIILCAKGLSSGYLPIGAVLISDKLINSISYEHAQGALFSQGFTYSGHPVCCAAALKNIEIIEQEHILEHVREVESYFQAKLLALRELSCVSTTRGMGLLGAIECDVSHLTHLDDTIFAEHVADYCRDEGLLVRILNKSLILSPPLIITQHDIDLIFDRLHNGLMRAQNEPLTKNQA